MNDDNVVYLADQAQACLASGQLEEARSLYLRLSATDGQNEEIWLALAAINGETGSLDEALSCANQAIKLDAEYVEAYLTRAHLLLKLEQPEEALQSALKAVEIDDEYTEAWVFLAGTAGQLNRYLDAEQWARKAVALAPDNADAHANLAYAQNMQGNPDAEHSYRQVLRIQPDNIPAQVGIARSLMAQQRYEEAAGQLQAALQHEPDNIEALDRLGLCYTKLERPDDAAAIFQGIIKRDADYQPAYLRLAEVYDRQGNYLGAIKCLEQAKKDSTDPLELLGTLVAIYHNYGMHHYAIERCDEALKLDPENFDVRFYRVLSLADSSKYEEALAELSTLESEAPGDLKLIGTHAGLLERMGDYDAAHDMVLPHLEDPEITGNIVNTYARLCHRFDECDHAISLVNKALAKPSLNKGLRRAFLFTLGQLHDRRRDYDAAFACIREANELKPYQYNHAQYTDYVDRLLDKKITRLAANPPTPVNRKYSVRPVFIVGMPRSGTSLVEQIIATHPQVYGGGERHAISSIVRNLPGWLGVTTEYPECLAALSPVASEQILESYTQFTEGLPAGTVVMTDKMPENFQHLVLIRMLFPESRIIHCVRDPKDTCLSCYFQQFTGYHEYAYDLGDLGKHYCEYQRLMKHYRDEAAIPMLEVNYQELVSDTEKVSRQMIEYCGLEWDERCLRYYESDRITRTASYSQVRQPIYTRSVNRWKNYEKHLHPLLEALQD